MDVKQDTQLTWSFEEDKFPDPLMPPPVGFEPRTLNFNNRYSVLYQLSWVEAVTHPITYTAQWCLTSVMYEIPVYQLYHSATDKSLGWGTTLLSCVLQSRSWCSEPCHEFCTTWPLVLLSYKDTRSELTAHLILYHVRVQSLILPFLGLELTMMMRLRDFYIMQCATASIAPGSW